MNRALWVIQWLVAVLFLFAGGSKLILQIRPDLTPLAAGGLVVIMIGATAVTLMSLGVMQALIPLAVGILTAFVAYGRRRRSSPAE